MPPYSPPASLPFPSSPLIYIFKSHQFSTGENENLFLEQEEERILKLRALAISGVKSAKKRVQKEQWTVGRK